MERRKKTLIKDWLEQIAKHVIKDKGMKLNWIELPGHDRRKKPNEMRKRNLPLKLSM